MKRLSPLFLLLPLTALLVVLATPAARAQSRPPSRPAADSKAPASPSKPVPGSFTHPKLKGWINDTPDTGQFLADSVWLLRVGPRVSTAGSYVREWFAAYPEFRPGQDSTGRVKFLQTLMNRDILGLTATALNTPTSFEDRLKLRETRQRALASAVYERFVRDSIQVTEAEVRTLWEQFSWLQRFRHILLVDRASAERVRRELVSGRITWAAAVKKYSVATNDKGPHGELGWARRDQLDPNVAYRIYGLKPGETSPPVQDREGWHIVQSMERKPESPPAYEALQRSLRDQIYQVKSAERSERLLALLRERERMVYDTANVVFASSKFRETIKYKQEAMAATFEFDGSVPEFDPRDTSRVLASWRNGGRFTLQDLVHSYHEIPVMLRPSLNLQEAVFAFVETIVLEPSIAEYGAERGLEQDSLVTEPLRLKREQQLVERMYQDSVASRTWVSKEDRRAYYEKNKPQFFTYPSVTFAAILRGSKAGADSVSKQLAAGVPPHVILAADSAAGFMSGSIQSRHQGEQGPYHKSLFEEMRPGDIDVRGPDRDGEYAIIKLLTYDGGRQLSYEESELMIDESLQNIKADEALQALIARLKPRYPVAWRPELVMYIKMVDPTLD